MLSKMAPTPGVKQAGYEADHSPSN